MPPSREEPGPPKDPSEDARGLASILDPDTIAVVGAGREAGIGRRTFENLLEGDFQGPVYPVNPSARSIRGVRAYPSVQEVPDEVELAVIVVPADKVLHVVEDCGQAGVDGLVVITAGFGEVDEEGAQREHRLVELAQRYGMRIVGPNCMGVVNTAEDVAMNATFSESSLEPGGLAFASQSGALGLAILDLAEELGLGLSEFVSLGNRVDVSSNDLLERWSRQDRVDAMLLYLEHFGNPRNFLEIARRVGRQTPLLAVKSGRSKAGARAAASHTGALAERAELAEALFEQCGVVHAHTIDELFQLARVFGRAERPDGRGVAIVTNSGGPGVMATDALEDHGLVLAELSDETRQRLREHAPSIATVANPFDLTAGAGPESYRRSVEILAADEGVDTVLAIYTPPTFQDDEAVARALLDAERGEVPMLACVLGRGDRNTAFHLLSQAGVATFTFPESAVQSLAAYVDWMERSRQPVGAVPALDVDRTRAETTVEQALDEGRAWLSAQEADDILEAYGIPTPDHALSATPEATRRLADQVGFPLVLKGVGEDLVHKTEHDAVQLGIESAEEAGKAHERLQNRLAREGIELDAVLLQPEVSGEHELLIGTSSDPHYGTLVGFGLGGIHAEVFDDTVFRLAPLTDADATRMVRAIDAWPLLKGVRGQPRADVDAVEDTLLRLSRVATDLPAIREIDLNPVIVGSKGEGLEAVDIRVRLWEQGEPPRPAPVVDR